MSVMRQLMADPSMPENLRSLCAQAIGMCCYFSVEQSAVQQDCLQSLRQIWSLMKPNTASAGLFSSCVFSWVLLLERVSAEFRYFKVVRQVFRCIRRPYSKS